MPIQYLRQERLRYVSSETPSLPAATGRLLRFISTSPGFAWLLMVVVLPLMAAGPGVAAWAAFAGVFLFSIADPFLILRRGSWWLGATLSFPSWIVLFLVLGGTATKVANLREGATIFVLPMMVYPAALAIAGLIRLVTWGLGRKSS